MCAYNTYCVFFLCDVFVYLEKCAPIIPIVYFAFAGFPYLEKKCTPITP